MEIQWTHLKEVLDRYGNYFCNLVQQKMMQNNSNATGGLVNSFTYRTFIDNNHFGVVVEMEDYWKYVNDGRKAGKQPPLWKIKQWVIVKQIHPRPYTYTPTVKSLVYLIQRSIKEKKGFAPPKSAIEDWITKKGIKPQPRRVIPSVDSLAFLIARKIGRVGTKGTKFFTEAEKETYDHFKTMIEDAVKEDFAAFVDEAMAELTEAIE